MNILFKILNVGNKAYKLQMSTYLKKARIVPGLYSRQIGDNGYPDDHPQAGQWNSVSHDEYNGIIMWSVYADRIDVVDDVVTYGMQNFWCFDDQHPYQVNFRFWRQPRDRAFYKWCSSFKPSIIDKLWFLTSSIVTCLKRGERVDGELQLFYKLKTLELIECDSMIVRLVNRIYRKAMRKFYGDQWLVTLHTKYFPFKHPIQAIIRYLVDRGEK
jgi:hypothetical protein